MAEDADMEEKINILQRPLPEAITLTRDYSREN